MIRYLRSSTVLGTLSFVSLVGVLAACSDDDPTAEPPPATNVDAGSTTDGSTDVPDSSNNPDATVPPPGDTSALSIIVDMPYVDSNTRFCFLANTTGENLGPADVIDTAPVPTDPAGLESGRLGRVELPTAFDGKAFQPIALYTDSLEAFGLSGKSCAEIIQAAEFTSIDGGAPGQLLEGLDFDMGAVTAVGALKDSAPNLLLVTGCPKSTKIDTTDDLHLICGDAYEVGVTSTFQTYFHTLDSTAASAGKNRVQYLFGSWVHYNAIQQVFGTDSLFPTLHYSGTADTTDVPGPGSTTDDLKPFTFLAADGPLSPAPGVEVPALSNAETVALTDDPTIPGWNHAVADGLELSGLTAFEDGKPYVMVSVGGVFIDPPTIDSKPNPRYFHTLFVPAFN